MYPKPELHAETRIVISPIAAPSIMGLFGYGSAAMVTGSWLAGWWGDASSPFYFAPFVLLYGGIVQLLAALWDALAVGMHSAWGSYWTAYGILQLLIGLLAPPPDNFGAFAIWFVPLAAITWIGTILSLTQSIGLAAVLGTLALSSTLFAVGNWRILTCVLRTPKVSGYTVVVNRVGGYVLFISSILALYVGTALMVANETGYVFPPVFVMPKSRRRVPVATGAGEPGVKKGQ
ncbi:uncharacterized protein ACA1_046860 [Acanthamoeba castellanii str. Neff]|uniref:GPR1/FUN34/yaaH family protein n=1 Tax=Acanthamoeba castellanii (strain ATCC 30010 / Neff) TaxID=1257118 RepID=L8HC37_ACACF|nr:uncharacterized protein ACA1_046860 [Acanthamoeba castellanii str. Neff]ELR21956.1 hypothetical protein ACA1_046860 [Acanthamoeba castellanii str. Neff]